ncbi:MAG TPA: glycosyltransferase [Caldimonas sp.]|jgi:glycosyltransferase involved in cell wall biosynthesis|nr:glycosyltransferase [Caldimonas sp.]HEX2541120.1 glycosyltransferase [Caldimonas sp.]
MHRLALVMIVRDEACCLERCLASARPWVDDMLVLDTGSVDASVAIAERAGARVERFDWIDDFAAARNAALAHSEAAWNLVLDADEWIAEGGEGLAALRAHAPDHLGQVRVVSAFDAGGGRVVEAPSWLPRVLPRGVRYVGRIHEQPESSLPRQPLPLVVGHDGYRDDRKSAKAGRNERLLGLALAAAPDDAYLHYQLGKDLELKGRFAEAEPHYAHALARCDALGGWRHDLVLRALFTLKRLGRFEAAIALAAAEMPRWPHSPDFFFTLGDLFLEWAAAQPQRGSELLPMIESSWLKALAIGEQPQLQDTVRGRGSFLAAHNLAVLHASLGADAEAARWREREASLRND